MMTTPQKYSVNISYSDTGLPIIEQREAKLTATTEGKRVKLIGDKEGLLLLAQALIGMAHFLPDEEQAGFHLHIDDLYQINEDGVDFVVYKTL